ncbi:MAG: hypothetical protein NTZ74_10480 [Chloroflexi bacterium]|nr:hypothetical protein [Chloroflexota bacterium]
MKKIIVKAMEQLRLVRRLLIVSYALIILVFVVIGVLSWVVPNVRILDLIGDMAATGHLPIYTGFISQIGLFLWSATVAVCFVTVLVLIKRGSAPEGSLQFLSFAGFLTSYLLVDDAFMVHDELFPAIFGSIGENVLYFILMILILTFLYFNRKEIFSHDYSLLFLALILFGFSMFFDMIPFRFYTNFYYLLRIEPLFEDGAKFMAILTWLFFFGRYSIQLLSCFPKQKEITVS